MMRTMAGRGMENALQGAHTDWSEMARRFRVNKIGYINANRKNRKKDNKKTDYKTTHKK